MNRYVMKFYKDGYVKYTSHLDLLRIFKRSFKKTGLALQYSQGFNPHPKMGFAQPFSLGYSSKCELIEFETVENHDPADIFQRMKAVLPEGLEPVSCVRFDSKIKSLAGEADSAKYVVWAPIPDADASGWSNDVLSGKISAYLDQTEITAMKRQKKTKKLAPVDIRKMIRGMNGMIVTDVNGSKAMMLTMHLDCGSTSNLSPELVIATFLPFCGLDIPRHHVEVERKSLKFVKNLQF